MAGTMVYNVNSNATQVLASKLIKENIFINLLHRNGKGVTEHEQNDCSTLRIFKVKPNGNQGRELGAGTNGGFFNTKSAQQTQVVEYDLNLLYVVDRVVDLPEVQQDMVAVDIFTNTMKNLGGEVATEINASTIATQFMEVWNEVAEMTTPAWTDKAVVLASTAKYYESFLEASAQLDEGDPAHHIQSFPFDERQAFLTTSFRKGLMSASGVILGGSNYAQSMIAKGAVSPDAKKEFGNFYIGEIDNIPCYLLPKQILDEADEWLGGNGEIDDMVALMVTASATDRGISGQDYVKVIDSPDGAGKRLQPKTRWGVEVCYNRGIVPILKYNTSAPASAAAKVSITAPEN